MTTLEGNTITRHSPAARACPRKRIWLSAIRLPHDPPIAPQPPLMRRVLPGGCELIIVDAWQR